ncbi:MAG: LOG family protein [Acidobacteriota bacterium]|nr:LOG family protein [Acidobacteriota bacterium]
MKRELIISVFGSSRPGENDPEYAGARALGKALAKKGFGVCTGAYGGTMEAVCRGVKDAGGKTYGVTAEFFPAAKANEWVDVEIRVKTWQERLFEIIRLADGFVVCKGGTGTLAELAVAWEMMNKSVIAAKPFVALGEFWEPLLKCVRDVETGHKNPWAEVNAQIVRPAGTPEEAAEILASSLMREK